MIFKKLNTWIRIRKVEQNIQLALKSPTLNIPLINSFRAEISALEGESKAMQKANAENFETWQKTIDYAEKLESQLKKTTGQMQSLVTLLAAINTVNGTKD